MKLNSEDLYITTLPSEKFKKSQPFYSNIAVRVAHIPTGLSVECDDHFAAKLNKRDALQALKELLKETN